MVENFVGKGENAGCLYFLPFPQYFSKILSFCTLKAGTCKVDISLTNGEALVPALLQHGFHHQATGDHRELIESDNMMYSILLNKIWPKAISNLISQHLRSSSRPVTELLSYQINPTC